MKKLRIVLISLFVLFSVVMIFAMLIPANTRVSRAINIRGVRDSLRASLLDVQQWVNWHPNLRRATDSNKVEFSAPGQQPWLKFNGFTMQLSPQGDTALNVDMTNPKGGKLESIINIIKLNGDTCVVNWYADFHTNWYPWERFRSMFFDQLYGPSLDSNLAKFKAYIEK